MSVILDAKGISKSYGPHAVLDGVDLTLHAGERAGLVGLNGSGKTTLGRILAGVEEPDGGEVARQREAKVVYLPQTADGLDPARTAMEEVLGGLGAWTEALRRHERLSADLAAGGGDLESLLAQQAAAAADVERLGGWEQSHRASEVLGYLSIRDPGQRLGSMSGGERRRVALARVLVARPTLAILDEPTNHLDVETIEWLEGHLQEDYPGALLLITHDRYVLNRVARSTLELSQGKLYRYDGGYEAYLEAKARRLEQEARAESNRQRFLKTELEWLRRQPKARMGKQKARRQRAEQALEAGPPAAERQARLRLTAERSSKWLLEIKGLELALGERTLVRGLDFILTRGERVGIVGPNGCGKTTLLRAILGQLAPAGGTIRLGKTVKPSYLDQARDGLDEERSILENVADRGRHVHVGGQMLEVHSYLERFLFRGDAEIQRPVGSLSGGERMRVALARVLQGSANLLILDEPTNDLDVSTLSALEQMLLEFGGTALVVTHDRWFLDRVATGLLYFDGDGRVLPYAGNYSMVRDLRRQRPPDPVPVAEEPGAERRREVGSAGPKARRNKRALTYGERLELKSIEGSIEAAERRVAGLEAALADPATYQGDGQQDGRSVADSVARLSAELDAARAEAEQLMTRWEELETKREADESASD